MSDVDSDSFGTLRSIFFPIHRHELKKFIPMLLIAFLVSFNYNILRTLKDTLVVTAKSSGAEVIPFIKVWVMFPGTILMTFLYTRLSNRMPLEKVIYCIISIFLIYFFLFVFVLYPNRNTLHFHSFADRLQLLLPVGCKGMIAMIRNWTFTIFYVMSELWSNIVLFVLFWGFANQVTRLDEAKRFYSLFGFGANFSGIIAGQISVFLCKKGYNPHLPFGKTADDQAMMQLVFLVVLSGCFTLALFRSVAAFALESKVCQSEGKEKAKEKLSLKKSFSFLFRSQYLLFIATIVICYNIGINLVEVMWKDQMKELYPGQKEFNIYYNQVSTIIGIVATFASLFVSGNLIRLFGWRITATLTPLVLLSTSALFIGLYFYKGSLANSALLAAAGMTPLSLIVHAGSLQNILSRGAKYTVFDASKEMAFVPLSMESKVKGKAAIDGVCNRLGKSGGAIIHQSLLLVFSSFIASTPFIAAILAFFIGIWIVAIQKLGKQFDRITGKEQSLKAQIQPTSKFLSQKV